MRSEFIASMNTIESLRELCATESSAMTIGIVSIEQVIDKVNNEADEPDILPA
jgi:hypothetical protein